MNTGLDALRTASKKVVYKTAEITGEFLGNKTANKTVKQKPVIDENSRNVGEIIIPPEKREEILNKLRQVLMEHYKIPKLLNNSTVSKFVTKKWLEVNDLPSDQCSVNKIIGFKTSMSRSNLCNYRDAYVVVKERITVEGDNYAKTRNKKLIFKTNVPFIENAEDLDIVMPTCNLLELLEVTIIFWHEKDCGIIIEMK